MLKNQKLTIEYEAKSTDYKALCNFTVFFKRRFTMVFFITIALFSFVLIAASTTGILRLPEWYVLLYVGVILFIIIALLLQKALMNRLLSANKISRNKKKNVIDEKMFKQRGGGKANVEYCWNSFSQTYETKKYFFFYISNQQAYVIAKRAMSREEITFLRALLTEEFGKNFYRRCKEEF